MDEDDGTNGGADLIWEGTSEDWDLIMYDRRFVYDREAVLQTIVDLTEPEPARQDSTDALNCLIAAYRDAEFARWREYPDRLYRLVSEAQA